MKHFLLVYNKKTGNLLRTQEYEADQGGEALEERFKLERQNRSDPDVEIVVLNANSLKSLRSTHARYFPNGVTEIAEKIAESLRPEPSAQTAH